MRDEHRLCPVTPQITHKFSRVLPVSIVNNMCIKSLLQPRNDPNMGSAEVYEWAFLPTMKLQLSQLPLIVGSGRVHF